MVRFGTQFAKYWVCVGPVQTISKFEKASSDVAELDEILAPAGAPMDQESITAEERYMFQKLGLKMKAYLEMGMRVAHRLAGCVDFDFDFDGTQLPLTFFSTLTFRTDMQLGMCGGGHD